MKVIALTLCLAALAQARVNYQLRCVRDEVGIRWPNYFSNSEFFICPQEHGKQMSGHCSPGEVFTFVLQQCTSPSEYIPPPPIEFLPIGSSAIIMNHMQENFFPKPVHTDAHSPPILNVAPVQAPQGSQVVPGPELGSSMWQEQPHEDVPHSPPHDVFIEEPIPTPPLPPPTPPNVKPALPVKKPVPNPNSGKKPQVPLGPKKPTMPTATGKKPAVPPKAPTAKKPIAPVPKNGKKPKPPTKAQ